MTTIGPRPALPPESLTLGATGPPDVGPVAWWVWQAHLERRGFTALTALVEAAWRRGFVYDYRLTDDDAGTEAVLDVIGDDEFSIVHHLGVPTVEAWAWWRSAAEFRRAPDDLV